MTQKKALFATIIGNALEYYDLMLYGFFAATLSPLFFPTKDPSVSIMAGFGTFAASFLMRPLGGIFFGHLGDRLGRRQALAASILLISLPTFLMGLLPPYEVIGLAAPLLLIICRLIQGISIGGEFSGAAIFISEQTSANKAGLSGGILTASGSIGALIGTALGALFTLSIMPSWGWRIPFLLGGLFGVFGFYIRSYVQETPAFITLKTQNKIVKSPLMQALKRDRWLVLCCVLISGAALVPFYLASIYMNAALVHKLHLSSSHILLINTGLMVLQTVMVFLFGYLSDFVGQRRLMMGATLILCVLSYPLFLLIGDASSLSRIHLAQVILCLVGPGFVSPIAALFPKLFPTQERYSAMAFSSCLGGALFGGTAPLIAAALVKWTGLEAAPAFYLMGCSLMGFISVWALKHFVPLSEQGSSLKYDSQKVRYCA